MTGRAAGVLLTVALAPIAWCIAIGAIVGGDPMHAVEIAAAVLTAAWMLLAAFDLARSSRLARTWDRQATEVTLHDVNVRLTPAIAADAVVVGAFRPTIYVGVELFEKLSDVELRAVLLHEDHHRRTRAPLRAAALGAWLRLLRPSAAVRRLLAERLADLESLADADAIRRGSSPRSLARALLKGAASVRPASLAHAAERRIVHLLDRAAGRQTTGIAHVPYEWLPVSLLAVVAVGCHVPL